MVCVQVDQWGEVIVGGAGAAVKGDEGDGVAGEVAYDFVPGGAGLVGVRGREGDAAGGGFCDGHCAILPSYVGDVGAAEAERVIQKRKSRWRGAM